MAETRISKRLWIQFVLTVLACATIWTNPSQIRHEDQLRARARAASPMVSAFLQGGSTAPKLEYRSYLFFSVTRVAGEPTTFGILGRVFAGGERE